MRLLARATAGLWLWAFGFSLLYALHGIGCARGWERAALAGASQFDWIMVGTWLMLIAGGAALLWWARRRRGGLEGRLALASAVVGLVGTIVTGMPVVATSACI